MALAQLLLGGDANRPIWVEAGTVMIAVDTLVLNCTPFGPDAGDSRRA